MTELHAVVKNSESRMAEQIGSFQTQAKDSNEEIAA
jgi:hypothetical protein